jgi:phosphatidylethanolamine-binding protein (PEBP) family uncharacterized protein
MTARAPRQPVGEPRAHARDGHTLSSLRLARVLCAAIVVLAIVCSGCGGGSSGRSATASRAGTTTSGGGVAGGEAAAKAFEALLERGRRKHEGPVSSITISSTAIVPGANSAGELPRRFTCDGRNSSLPLRWHGVPAGTHELMLLVANEHPVRGRLFFDWAVAGLSPTATGLQAGKLPAGAIVGRNGFGQAGYTICPPTGKREVYMFVLYALPRSLSPSDGFDPMPLYEHALRTAHESGLMAGAYTRR